MHIKCLTCNMIADPDAKLIATFKTTGCLNPNVEQFQLDWWKSVSDKRVFDDMMYYCEYVRDGIASTLQEERCCGNKDCTVSTCTRQTTWRYGKFYF